MILINNQWEQVKSIDDVKRIIKENLSEELADEIDNVLQEEFSYHEYEMCSSCTISDDYDVEVSQLKYDIEALKEIIYSLSMKDILVNIKNGTLQKYIDSFKDKMEIALEII